MHRPRSLSCRGGAPISGDPWLRFTIHIEALMADWKFWVNGRGFHIEALL